MRNLHNGGSVRNNFLTADFGELMRQVAPLFGYDPGRADRKGVARYRSRGSLRIDFRQGLFADYENGEAGGVFAFIERETGEPPIEWLRRNHFDAPAPAACPRPRRSTEDHGAERRELTPEERERIELAWTLWEAARPIDGIAAVTGYLASRHLELGDTSQFRFHPKTPWHPEGEPLQHRACLLVAYRSFDDDQVTGLSRILVDEPERWPRTRRMMLGVVRRAAVKLAPVTDTLGIAEGVETAIAANMMGYGPAWALGSAGAVATMSVLPQINRLILLAENNKASHDAVERCAKRWLRAGRKVRRVLPDQGCDDLADELMMRRAV